MSREVGDNSRAPSVVTRFEIRNIMGMMTILVLHYDEEGQSRELAVSITPDQCAAMGRQFLDQYKIYNWERATPPQ